MTVFFKLLRPEGRLPMYTSTGAAGADLFAAEGCEIKPGARVLVPLGISIEIPESYEGQIRSRSGFASNGVVVLNSPGTIDSDYRGEVKVLLINHSVDIKFILPGDRIAQLVIAPVSRQAFRWSPGLSVTDRGEGGFGSTGR